MARGPPIKRSDHKKNKGKKPDQEDNQPQKKDDDSYIHKHRTIDSN
jgi:hypothetical protein